MFSRSVMINGATQFLILSYVIVFCSSVTSVPQGSNVMNFLSTLAYQGGSSNLLTQIPGMNILQQYLPSGVQQYLPSETQQYQPSGIQQYQTSGLQQYLPLGIQQYLASGIQQYLPDGIQQYLPSGLQSYPSSNLQQSQYPTYGSTHNHNGYGLYAPGHGSYYPVDSSVLGALTSIAKYDDLKCVPRLLCEMAAGGRPGHTGKQDTGETVLPFVSRDTLLTLLTIFNFGDTSPLLVFGRAVLLGVTSRGASHTCYSAYPTCPRNPNHLVYYLNNHRGGFFQYFNNLQRPAINYNYQSRILNNAHHHPRPHSSDPYPFESVQNYKAGKKLKYTTDPDYVKNTKYESSFAFPTKDSDNEIGNYPVNAKYTVQNFAFPLKGNNIKSYYQQNNNQPMVFPDRTGTGDLRLDTDLYGNIIISSVSANRQRDYQKAPLIEKKPISFPSREQRHVESLKFPSSHE